MRWCALQNNCEILNACLMHTLPKLISPHQTTFIPRHHINKNISPNPKFLMGFNAKSMSRWATISIDFCKAFDTLHWDAIDVSLEALGFNDIFRKLIQACLHFVSFSTLIEGSPMTIIQASHGVHQGDLLSPLLFIVVLEYLSTLTRLVLEDRIYDLYTMGRAKVISI